MHLLLQGIIQVSNVLQTCLSFLSSHNLLLRPKLLIKVFTVLLCDIPIRLFTFGYEFCTLIDLGYMVRAAVVSVYVHYTPAHQFWGLDSATLGQPP